MLAGWLAPLSIVCWLDGLFSLVLAWCVRPRVPPSPDSLALHGRGSAPTPALSPHTQIGVIQSFASGGLGLSPGGAPRTTVGTKHRGQPWTMPDTGGTMSGEWGREGVTIPRPTCMISERKTGSLSNHADTSISGQALRRFRQHPRGCGY